VLNLFKILLAFGLASLIVGVGTVAGLFWHFSHGLPDHKQLADYQPATVSRLYAADGRLLMEYAREKRVFVPVAAMPKRLLQAFVAAEDQRFFTHPGVDIVGVVRASLSNLANPGKRPEGASGITQQVAKNFLLNNQATLARKIREAILAFRIEETYSKERILELYLNEIYLGAGNYGIAAAALNYFDRSLGELSLSEIAYLAALPKAPNRYSITKNEKEAYARRDYVLGRMKDDGYINAAEEQAAKAERLTLRKRSATETAQADFFSEEVRRNLLAAYGEQGLYEGGLTVSTTLDPALQKTADIALREGLITYDRRHGWRGPYAKIADMKEGTKEGTWEEEFARIQQRRPMSGPETWRLAVVSKVEPTQAQIVGLPAADGSTEGTIPFAEMQWACATGPNQTVGACPGRPANVVSVGDVVVVEKVEKNAAGKPWPPNTYGLRQIPNANGAVVVMDPRDGRILAMSGGWSYGMSQFNRAVQAQRQPGSSFKPFVYLAAMDSGLTPSSIVLDAPFEYSPGYGQPVWRPGNYGNEEPLGPITVRNGLEKSRNLVTVRMAQQIGMAKVVKIAHDFGIADKMGAYLPMALGAVDTTLLRMTMAHAMLANGAREITPSLIDRVQDRNGKTIYRHEPRVCQNCGEAAPGQKPAMPEIVDNRQPFHDPATVYQVLNMMMGVTVFGTAAQLGIDFPGRPIAGKTGTTNDSRDTWFIGSVPDLTIGVYIGFDEPRTLGRQEQGSFTALPIYERVAKVAFKDKPPTPFRIPPGLRIVRVNHDSGQPAGPGEGRVIDEAFKPGTEPGSGYNDGTAGAPLDGSAPFSGIDPSVAGTPGATGAAGTRRSTLTGTGETY
jgi:penicillin-binding protein 1A